MGQILILHDDGEISATLSPDNSVVRVAGVPELQRMLTAQSFDVAILVQPPSPEPALAVLHSLEPDLAILLIHMGQRVDVNTPPVWEALSKPVPPNVLRAAVHRASQRTESLRQIRSLRAQLDPQNQTPVPAAGNGSASHLHWISSLPPRFDLRELLSSVEKGVILRMLEATHGAQAEAARRLGLSRSDLSYKLAKYELRKPTSIKSE